MIKVKRIYDGAGDEDGVRVLVDRVWPRGMTRDAAAIDRWMKEIAPSSELRKWFDHDPAKWDAFLARYARELDGQGESVRLLKDLSRKGTVTLLFAAKDEAHNNAVALKEYLDSR